MDKPKLAMEEPVGFELSPEDALKVLVQATQDRDVDTDPPVGGWIDEERD